MEIDLKKIINTGIKDSLILEQFNKQFFTFGDLCSEPKEFIRDYTVCGFFRVEQDIDENYCSFFDGSLMENKRCDKCKEVLG